MEQGSVAYSMTMHDFDEAVHAIREGRLVAFPTETVYGLGANALDSSAVVKIFTAKGRPSDNPLIVHVAKKEQIGPLVKTISPLAQKMMDAFMPGPITLIFDKSDLIPYEVSAGLDTVGIRIPSHPVANLFLEKAQIPVAAPSANISGRPSPTTAQHVFYDMKGKIPFVIDGGECNVGVESTVVDVRGEIPTILRPGGITAEQIRELCGNVDGIGSSLSQTGSYAKALNQDTPNVPMAPGMKYRHYAPKATVVLADAPDYRQRLDMIFKLMDKYMKENRKIGLYAGNEMVQAVTEMDGTKKETDGTGKDLYMLSYGPDGDAAAASAGLFSALRDMDDHSVDIVIAEALPIMGIGVAYMNRLLKAAGIKIK